MRYQIILDQRPEFQTLVTEILDTIKGYELGIRTTKVRIFAAAIRATYDADLAQLAALAEQIPELNKLRDDRQNKMGPHHFVFIYPKQMDYVKFGLGRLSIEENIRLDERGFIHLAIYYFNSLSKINQIVQIKVSDEIHPIKHKKRRPNNWRNLPEYQDEIE